MSRIVYVNGAYVPEEEAKVSVFDRGFLFADGVYEVTSVLDGRLVDFAGHMARLRRSLGELEMPAPARTPRSRRSTASSSPATRSPRAWSTFRSTRGAADRDFAYPAEPVPSLVLFTQARALVDSPRRATASG